MAVALGMSVLQDDPGKLVLTTSEGDLVEYLTPETAEPRYLFDVQDTVIGYLVDDLDVTLQHLADAGVTPIGEPGEGGGVRFRHVRSSGGAVYGLIQRV